MFQLIYPLLCKKQYWIFEAILFNSIYVHPQQGSTIYRLLEHVIFKDHPDAFVEAMRTLVQEHLFSVANYADVLKVMHEVCAVTDIAIKFQEKKRNNVKLGLICFCNFT